VHAKVAKIKGILAACDEICGRLEQLDAVIVQPSADPGAVVLVRFRHGTFIQLAPFPVESENESLDARLRTALQHVPELHARSATQFSEELAMLKRWFYRTHKTGEIIVAGADGELSVRKLANAVMRVFRGEKPPTTAAQLEPDPASDAQSAPVEDKPPL